MPGSLIQQVSACVCYARLIASINSSISLTISIPAGGTDALLARFLMAAFGLEAPAPAPTQLVYWLHVHNQEEWELECDVSPRPPLPDAQHMPENRMPLSVRVLQASSSILLWNTNKLEQVPALLQWAYYGADSRPAWTVVPAAHDRSFRWWSLVILHLATLLATWLQVRSAWYRQ